MSRLTHWVGLLLLATIFCTPCSADELLMARSEQLFPEAMTLLQSAISARGYTITRLQEVNENLARREFKSDMYRVVYFGKKGISSGCIAVTAFISSYLPKYTTRYMSLLNSRRARFSFTSCNRVMV